MSKEQIDIEFVQAHHETSPRHSQKKRKKKVADEAAEFCYLYEKNTIFFCELDIINSPLWSLIRNLSFANSGKVYHCKLQCIKTGWLPLHTNQLNRIQTRQKP